MTNHTPKSDVNLSSLRASSQPKLEVVKDNAELDLNALRLDTALVEGMAAKVPLTIPVRRPPKHDWFRVHPDPAYRITVAAIDLKGEEETFYVIGVGMHELLLGTEAAPFTLYTYINRVGVLRLWPIRQADADGRRNEWHRTAERAAELGMHEWVRVVPNRSLGGYEVLRAAVIVPDPIWPDLTMADIIRVALRDRGHIVDDPDHPVLKKLQGRL